MRKLFRGLSKLLVFSFFGGLLAILRYILSTPQPLESVLPGEAHIYTWRQGHIFYKVLGPVDAPPLVLLHNPEIGASSYEMRHIMEGLAQHYRVYGLDLLGFGLSDHPRIDYSANTYVTLYQDFLKEVVRQPVILLASGLSCNYSVALATITPNLCTRLILLSPTTLFERRKQIPWLTWLIQNPIIGLVIYSIFTPRFVLRRVIAQQRRFDHSNITSDELDYMFASAHQSGAQHAALAFLAGKLGLEITHDFAALPQPTLIIWGMHALHFAHPSIISQHTISKHIQVILIQQAGSRVHEEQPEMVVAKILQWQTEENFVEATVSSVTHSATTTNAEIAGPSLITPTTSNAANQLSAIISEPISEPPAEDITGEKSIEAYCVKCRQKRFMHNPQKVLTKNGRSAMEGICPICSTKLFRFIAG